MVFSKCKAQKKTREEIRDSRKNQSDRSLLIGVLKTTGGRFVKGRKKTGVTDGWDYSRLRETKETLIKCRIWPLIGSQFAQTRCKRQFWDNWRNFNMNWILDDIWELFICQIG